MSGFGIIATFPLGIDQRAVDGVLDLAESG